MKVLFKYLRLLSLSTSGALLLCIVFAANPEITEGDVYKRQITVFEKLFVTGEADVVAEFYARNKAEAPEAQALHKLESQMKASTGIAPVGVAFDNQLNISVDRQKLLLYNVNYNEVYRLLKTAFKENEVATLRSCLLYTSRCV